MGWSVDLTELDADAGTKFNEVALAFAVAAIQHASPSRIVATAPTLHSAIFSSVPTPRLLRALAIRLSHFDPETFLKLYQKPLQRKAEAFADEASSSGSGSASTAQIVSFI